MREEFIRERITQLRLEKGVSEYQMSYDLGHSRGYVYNISSGKALPPLKEFLAICDYFGITPAEFFRENGVVSKVPVGLLHDLENLGEEDMKLVQALVERLKR